jgi:hypothetical protein
VLLLLPGTPETLARLAAERAAGRRAAAMAAPGRNVLPAQGERHQAAPPSASGAYPPYPLNSSVDGELVTLAGSPTNVDFEAAATDVGSPPPNSGFGSGDFTGWTPTESPTIGSDAAQGNYASLPASTAIQTANALTLDAGEQFVRVKVKGLSASADKAIVEVLSGAGFGTTTQVWSGTAGDGSWTTVEFFAQTWAGQDVELKVRNNGGTVGVDDVGVQRAKIPGWTIPSGAQIVAGSPSGSAIKIDGTLTSAAFTMPADAQQLTVRYRASDTSGTGVYVDLLHGAGFATVEPISVGVLGGPSGVWKTSNRSSCGSASSCSRSTSTTPGSSTRRCRGGRCWETGSAGWRRGATRTARTWAGRAVIC